MPRLDTIGEQIAQYKAQGKGHLSGHLVVWDEEIKARKEKKDKTRLQKELDSHDLYVGYNVEFDRIIEHVGNKAIAYGMILDWLRELKNPVLDRMMAAQEGPDV